MAIHLYGLCSVGPIRPLLVSSIRSHSRPAGRSPTHRSSNRCQLLAMHLETRLASSDCKPTQGPSRARLGEARFPREMQTVCDSTGSHRRPFSAAVEHAFHGQQHAVFTLLMVSLGDEARLFRVACSPRAPPGQPVHTCTACVRSVQSGHF